LSVSSPAGLTGLHAIVRADWAKIVTRVYGALLYDDTLVAAEAIFGDAWCSTVGWAGDLCISYT